LALEEKYQIKGVNLFSTKKTKVIKFNGFENFKNPEDEMDRELKYESQEPQKSFSLFGCCPPCSCA
jgi:hypothetical protein